MIPVGGDSINMALLWSFSYSEPIPLETAKNPPGSLVVFSLGAGEEFGDVIITEPSAQTQRAGFRAIAPRRRRVQDFLQPKTQGSIDDFLEGLPKPGCSFFRFGSYVGIER